MTTYLQKILILALLFLTASLAVNSSIHLAPRLNLAANDITYEFGATGNVLVWQFEAHESNDNPTSYTVKIDGVDLTGHIEASWEDNVDILVNVDGLNVGDHTVLIIVNDDGTDASLAPAATDTAIVTVTGGTSTTTTATSTTITSTTTTTTSTSVTSSQTSTLTPATSSFSTVTTTTESQTAANTATSTISTSETIIGDNKPKISSETDKTLNEGATGFSLSWTASDDNPDEYVIKVNKVSVQTNSWQSGVVIEYSLDGWRKCSKGKSEFIFPLLSLK
ncbi:MAG: hypothetical protein IH840_11715 [Candidatus Heimdallarchaeota archaeon]|nr:hypothetical protein [Candidatus Heimdallarchaeota archaeon]